MKAGIIFVFGIICTFMILDSCDDNITDIDDIVFPDSLVSYQDHVQPLMRVNCTLSNCHGPSTGLGAQPMYDYIYLTDQSTNIGLVIPYYPESSRLVQIFEYTLPHYSHYQWQINNNQLQGLKTWIEEGAKNN